MQVHSLVLYSINAFLFPGFWLRLLCDDKEKSDSVDHVTVHRDQAYRVEEPGETQNKIYCRGLEGYVHI
ncbi:hypothetical protein VTK73DRAFT_8238 [Phialemonium thermophilum]|uniref:Uncharacterized protein n=1 Tax=Phialemonium thermophilum TaxID=223376 RepID=A0ABR3XR14_9PEZI